MWKISNFEVLCLICRQTHVYFLEKKKILLLYKYQILRNRKGHKTKEIIGSGPKKKKKETNQGKISYQDRLNNKSKVFAGELKMKKQEESKAS